MSSAAASRTAFRVSLRRTRTSPCSRHFTSSPSSSSASSSSSTLPPKLDVQPKSKLPADKMRALVELYQVSESFITKETLSAAIDKVFVHRFTESAVVAGKNVELSVWNLQTNLERRKTAPKFGQNMDVLPARQAGAAGKVQKEEWSDYMHPRELEVMAALYGVVDKGLPAYEVLQDAYEDVKAELEQEKGERRASGGSQEGA